MTPGKSIPSKFCCVAGMFCAASLVWTWPTEAPAFRCVVVDLGSGSTGIIWCSVGCVNGVATLRSGAEVSFLDDCPTTTWPPVGPVKTVPAGPLCADEVETLEAAEP